MQCVVSRHKSELQKNIMNTWNIKRTVWWKKYSSLIFRGAWENHPKLGFGHHGMEMVATPLSWLNWICWKNMNVSIIKYNRNLFFECSCFQTPSTIWHSFLHYTPQKNEAHSRLTEKKHSRLVEKKTAGWIFRVFVKNSFSIGKGWGDSVQLHRLWPFVSHKNKHTWLSVFCWKFKNKPPF